MKSSTMSAHEARSLLSAGIARAAILAISACCAIEPSFADDGLSEAVKADLKNVVRQGGVGERPFWRTDCFDTAGRPDTFDFRVFARQRER